MSARPGCGWPESLHASSHEPRAENLLAQEKLRWLAWRKCEKMPVEIQKIVPARRSIRFDHGSGSAEIDRERRVTRLQRYYTRRMHFPSTSRFPPAVHPRERTRKRNFLSPIQWADWNDLILPFARTWRLFQCWDVRTWYFYLGIKLSVYFIVRRASVIPSVRAMYPSIARIMWNTLSRGRLHRM